MVAALETDLNITKQVFEEQPVVQTGRLAKGGTLHPCARAGIDHWQVYRGAECGYQWYAPLLTTRHSQGNLTDWPTWTGAAETGPRLSLLRARNLQVPSSSHVPTASVKTAAVLHFDRCALHR
jgi:hypothetical protein